MYTFLLEFFLYMFSSIFALVDSAHPILGTTAFVISFPFFQLPPRLILEMLESRSKAPGQKPPGQKPPDNKPPV